MALPIPPPLEKLVLMAKNMPKTIDFIKQAGLPTTIYIKGKRINPVPIPGIIAMTAVAGAAMGIAAATAAMLKVWKGDKDDPAWPWGGYESGEPVPAHGLQAKFQYKMDHERAELEAAAAARAEAEEAALTPEEKRERERRKEKWAENKKKYEWAKEAYANGLSEDQIRRYVQEYIVEKEPQINAALGPFTAIIGVSAFLVGIIGHIVVGMSAAESVGITFTGSGADSDKLNELSKKFEGLPVGGGTTEDPTGIDPTQPADPTNVITNPVITDPGNIPGIQ